MVLPRLPPVRGRGQDEFVQRGNRVHAGQGQTQLWAQTIMFVTLAKAG